MHDLFIGQTGGGKTFLAMRRAEKYLAAGFGVLVLENILNKWPCTWQTRSLPDFVAAAKKSRKCALFIDDVTDTVGRDEEGDWLFKMARHWGHRTHALSHGWTDLTPSQRNQCSALYLFSDTAVEECEKLARAFNAPSLKAAATGPKHSFYLKKRGEPLRGPIMVTA
jgi:hypothetical protein